jgi:hypothetical protein
LAEVIAAVLGWCILLFGAGALSLMVFRRARAHGILAPLLVGLLLRLAVMLIAHAGSLSLGDHGFLALDDQTYFIGGSKLAAFWGAGQTPDPAGADILGTYQFGYQIFLGAMFTLGTTSVLLGKLVNVLFGGASIVVVALLGGRLLGDRAKLRAAWIVALAPSLVWWSAPLLKEALSTLLIALGLLAITYLPRPRAIAGVGAVAAYLMILRGPAALALMAGAGLAIALAGRKAERKWLSRPLVAFGVILLAGGVALGVVVSHGDLHNLYSQYNLVVHRMINQYQGNNPVRIPYDAVKSLVTPLPWVFNRGTQNWDRALFPGVVILMCALPLAVIGAWRLRRSPEAWALLGTAATALSINAVTSGFVFRQRSMIEPLILLLALAGARSWRMAARTVAVTLGVVAAAAGVQSRSPLIVALIVACAGALLLVSRRLPSAPFEAPPQSPMVASFRRSLAAREAAGAPSVLESFRDLALSLRDGLSRRAPRLETSGAPVGAAARGRGGPVRQALTQLVPSVRALAGERPDARLARAKRSAPEASSTSDDRPS